MNATRRIPQQGTWGNPSLEADEHIVLYFIGFIDPISLPIAKRYVLGRAEGNSADAGKIDLMPFSADEKGVSRAHAILDLSSTQVMLTDLDSKNGTYLNNEQLQPHQPTPVRSGDQIRLGELIGYIYFSKTVLNGA